MKKFDLKNLVKSFKSTQKFSTYIMVAISAIFLMIGLSQIGLAAFTQRGPQSVAAAPVQGSPVQGGPTCGKGCIYSENGSCHAGNCLDGSQNCDTNVNCGFVAGCSSGAVVDCPVTAPPPTTQSCPDDVTYCDPNVNGGTLIHKHGGVFQNGQCVYAFDNTGQSCGASSSSGTTPVCNSVSTSANPGTLTPGQGFTLNLSGDASTFTGDNFGGANCSVASITGSGATYNCTAPSNAGTYTWTHTWQHCEGSTSNCSSQCSASAQFTVQGTTPTTPPTSNVVCNSVSLTPSATAVNSGQQITFTVHGDASTFVGDSNSGLANCSGQLTTDGTTVTCTAVSSGSWTHTWKHCEGSTSNCSNQCSVSASFAVNQTTPPPSTQPSTSPGQGGVSCPAGTVQTIQDNTIVCVSQTNNQTNNQTANPVNNNYNTNNNTITIGAAPAAPRVVTVAGAQVKSLPNTGLPALGWVLGGLLPIGVKMRKFGSGFKDMLSAQDIWDEKQYKNTFKD